MDKKINIGVIGCGSRMIFILKELLKINPEHKIIGICDPDSEAIENVKRIFGGDITVYDDYEELASGNIDWIFIGSINSYHKDHIMSAISNNKNIFCEKPLVIKFEECKEIENAMTGKDIELFVGHNLRYSPHYNEIKRIVDSGKIGEIISLEFNETIPFFHGSHFMTSWRGYVRYTGGFLLEKCCHDLDLLSWIANTRPVKVASFGGRNFFIPKNSYLYETMNNKEEFTFKGKPIPNPFTSSKDIIDNQVVILECDNGIRATFHVNLSSGIPERRMYICGSEGTIRADVLTGKIEVSGINDSHIKLIFNKDVCESHGGGDSFMIEELDRVMKGISSPTISFHEAINSVIACLAIDGAMKTNKIVHIDSYQ